MNDFYKLWEELNQLEQEEFIDKSDYEDFQLYLSDPSCVLMEMANFVGNTIQLEKYLPFSFHICTKEAVHQKHGIRAKILWNPSKAPSSADGYMELHGDYDYTSGSHKYQPTGKELQIARDFFKKYKTLFAAVWEEVLDADPVQDYFKGRLSLKELLTKFDLKGRDYFEVNHCNTLTELEQCVREHNIFNMND